MSNYKAIHTISNEADGITTPKFYQQRVRKLLRISFLILILAIIIGICAGYSILRYDTTLKTFDSSKHLIISEQNCKLIIQEDPAIPENQVQLKAEIPGKKKTHIKESADGSSIEVTALNTGDLVDACWVRLSISSSTVFSGGLEFNCVEFCDVVHKSPITLDFGTSNVVLNGGKLSVNFQTIKSNKIEIASDKGDITIHSAYVASNSIIKTSEGNIAFQSVSPFKAIIQSENKYYCTSAPAYLIDGVDSCTSNESPTYPCTLTISLCTTSPCASVANPEIRLQGNYGNTYANIIPADNEPVTENYQVYTTTFTSKDVAYNSGTFGFDARTQKLYSLAYDTYNLTTKTDSLLLYRIGNYLGKASSSMNFAATPNPAYLSAKPWWMSFFSLSLLVGSTQNLPTRLVPGFCPYRPIPSLQDLYNVQTYIQDKMYAPPKNKDDVGMLYSTELPLLSNGYLNSYGYLNEPSTTDMYKLSLNKD